LRVQKKKRCFVGRGGSLLEAWGVVRVEDDDMRYGESRVGRLNTAYILSTNATCDALSSRGRCCHPCTEQRAKGWGLGGLAVELTRRTTLNPNRLLSLSLRLKDLLGPVTRVKKKKKKLNPHPETRCFSSSSFLLSSLELGDTKVYEH